MAERTQNGDPLPEGAERIGRELTVDELSGRVSRAPETTGPIALTRKCGECGKKLGPFEPCQVCQPGAKRAPLGGTNGIDRTMRNDVKLPWMRAR